MTFVTFTIQISQNWLIDWSLLLAHTLGPIMVGGRGTGEIVHISWSRISPENHQANNHQVYHFKSGPGLETHSQPTERRVWNPDYMYQCVTFISYYPKMLSVVNCKIYQKGSCFVYSLCAKFTVYYEYIFLGKSYRLVLLLQDWCLIGLKLEVIKHAHSRGIVYYRFKMCKILCR